MNNSTVVQQKTKKSLANDDLNKALEFFFYGIMASSVVMGVLYVLVSFTR